MVSGCVRKLRKGEKLRYEDIKFLRPCPKNSISPFDIEKYIGKKIKKNLNKNDLITKKCIIL